MGETRRFWSIAATVGVAGLAGYIATAAPLVAVYTAILVACGLLAHMARLSSLEILIILLPLSFVLTFGFGPVTGFDLNVSAADFFLPIAIVAALSTKASALVPSQGFTRAAIIYAVSLVSVAAASLLAASAREVNLHVTYGATAMLKMAISAGYLLMFYRLSRRAVAAGNLRFLAVWALTAYVISGLAIAGYVFYLSGIPTPFTQDYRLVGTFDDPNLFSSYLVISFCILLMSRIVEPKLWKTFAALAILASIVLTGSRAVIPAVLFGFVVAVLAARRSEVARRQIWRTVTVGLAFVAASFLVWNPLESLESVARIVTSDDTISSDGRIRLWSVAWRMWQEHPVLGVGIGQYRAVADQYVFGGVSNIAHNTYLSFLAETGLVGFVILVSLPLAVFLRVIRSRRRGNVFAPLLALGLAAVAVQALTLNLENSRALWAVLGISAAICEVVAPKNTRHESISRLR